MINASSDMLEAFFQLYLIHCAYSLNTLIAIYYYDESH